MKRSTMTHPLSIHLVISQSRREVERSPGLLHISALDEGKDSLVVHQTQEFMTLVKLEFALADISQMSVYG